MAATDELFSADIISADVQAALPKGYTIRPLRKSDYEAGFLETLRVLTTVGDFTRDQFNERFDLMVKHEGSYYVIVVVDSTSGQDKVVGTGAVIVEHKLYVLRSQIPDS
jgi:glucosamine-phosphate N-acetyltransferase